ncbi:MAG: hypothetical protein D6780_06335 [Candidatus Dadabacteria bacterium]|nr:MAG: hypothetical protein D6780_06335 [Candidatus Dadabacteria bacterium]
MWIFDLILTTFLHIASLILAFLPRQIAVWLVHKIILIIVFFKPSYKKRALRNISFVFKDKDNNYWQEIYDKFLLNIARFIVNSARMGYLSKEWFLNNVAVENESKVRKIFNQKSRGKLIITGHLGSFELFAAAAAAKGFKASIVVREFNLKIFNKWWNNKREKFGSKVVGRKGAFPFLLKELKEGRAAAILFDQNVRNPHGVFVDFFGHKAATSKLPALLILKTNPYVILAYLEEDPLTKDLYTIKWKEVTFNDLHLEKYSLEEKISLITERLNKEWEKVILAHPAEWFWFHRRWKTAPPGEKEDFYQC